MDILGRKIRYDEARTKLCRQDLVGRKQPPPSNIHKLRVYEVTTAFDAFKKYRIARGWLGVIRLHIAEVVGYWPRWFRLWREGGT
jgi:hypothetical protein